jgi:hypothetical protein
LRNTTDIEGLQVAKPANGAIELFQFVAGSSQESEVDRLIPPHPWLRVVVVVGHGEVDGGC